jgi:hypothetical protein
MWDAWRRRGGVRLAARGAGVGVSGEGVDGEHQAGCAGRFDADEGGEVGDGGANEVDERLADDLRRDREGRGEAALVRREPVRGELRGGLPTAIPTRVSAAAQLRCWKGHDAVRMAARGTAMKKGCARPTSSWPTSTRE